MRSAIFMIALSLPLFTGCTRAHETGNQPRWEQLHPEGESSAGAIIDRKSPISIVSAGVKDPPSNIVPPRPQDSSRSPLPSTFQISVPFTSQAPRANWEDPYQEACEEASLLMVHRFLLGEKVGVIPPDDADRDLLALVRWEWIHKYEKDVTLQELADISKMYYEHTPVIEDTVTIERIKELLVAGYPIIVPVAGRDLGNPYFSGEGPWYHMLVITGYDRNEFITNDPGTRRGESYEYAYDVLIAAIHDWTGVKEEIRSGKKRMMILKK
ncbi:MAG: Uncharacterized protein Greene101449_1406 [Candidatus Peregrinibacteria bacterium Greene1014_49]|nr:MAG: Uncharacterized protein Greene101449_1406 [Candidatus Peregrinibacteria bacterium Greene1014_49]